jgi:hypothetical protein
MLRLTRRAAQVPLSPSGTSARRCTLRPLRGSRRARLTTCTRLSPTRHAQLRSSHPLLRGVPSTAVAAELG